MEAGTWLLKKSF